VARGLIGQECGGNRFPPPAPFRKVVFGSRREVTTHAAMSEIRLAGSTVVAIRAVPHLERPGTVLPCTWPRNAGGLCPSPACPGAWSWQSRRSVQEREPERSRGS
jgi:hypothetical protein